MSENENRQVGVQPEDSEPQEEEVIIVDPTGDDDEMTVHHRRQSEDDEESGRISSERGWFAKLRTLDRFVRRVLKLESAQSDQSRLISQLEERIARQERTIETQQAAIGELRNALDTVNDTVRGQAGSVEQAADHLFLKTGDGRRLRIQLLDGDDFDIAVVQ